MSSLQVFLSHAGKSVWKTDENGVVPLNTVFQDYCEPNGFVVEKSFVDTGNQVVYLQINPDKTCLSDFFTWEEALENPAKPECWRHFYFIQDKENADWWSPQGLIEAEIQDYGNISVLYEKIKTYF